MSTTRESVRKPMWLRAVLGIAGFCAASTGLIGIMHTHVGLAIYAKVFGGGCPVGRASAADVEQGRQTAMRSVRGTRVSPARPAFGFRLDVTTRAEIDAWVSQHHLECRDRRERTLLTCDTVPSLALGREGAPLDEVSFAFTPVSLKLVNLTAVRYRLSAAEAVRHAGGVKVQLQSALGDPTRAAGVFDPAPLAATDYATVAVFYEFSDYIADLTATNIPGQGVLVREHYMSAVDNPSAPRAGG